jgi:hypothetical protein
MPLLQAVAVIAWSFSSLQIYDPKLFESLAASASRMLAQPHTRSLFNAKVRLPTACVCVRSCVHPLIPQGSTRCLLVQLLRCCF